MQRSLDNSSDISQALIANFIKQPSEQERFHYMLSLSQDDFEKMMLNERGFFTVLTLLRRKNTADLITTRNISNKLSSFTPRPNEILKSIFTEISQLNEEAQLNFIKSLHEDNINSLINSRSPIGDSRYESLCDVLALIQAPAVQKALLE